ncbi:MAG: isoprenylcysteine carboxylmethyltransferase family protein [Methanotrichaceae archaeon]|nr:isoprenylcysteine carboxylmethyltransferase family protein [Methanotrichaceae archaeon]
MQEAQFKIVLAALLLVDAGIRLYYQTGRKEFVRTIVKYERREKILYYLVSLGLIPIFFYVLTSRIDSLRLPFPAWLRWLGAGFIVTGDLLFIWSHRALGRNWSPFLEIRKGHVLVIEGPYRFIMHPMYAAIFLIGMGVSLLSANWLIALAYMFPVTIMYLIRVADEEEMMIEQFGNEYKEYMLRTGRLIPRLELPK